ncbi:MAG TPA: sigma-70 family RNA polymerase sigma factor, partial [Firmicutes bacterium]|nr:sigma-70 family RNA polymerase sigma factor [Bacillota bacterium]
RRYNAFSLDEPILAEEGEVGRQLADPSPGPLECLERAELQQQIYAALDRLSEVHRTVLVLHDLQGLRYDEVARLMGCSVGTVKSRLFYARRKLSQLLADYCLE